MMYLRASDLKVVLNFKQANICYVEHCWVMRKEGCELYLTEAKKRIIIGIFKIGSLK